MGLSVYTIGLWAYEPIGLWPYVSYVSYVSCGCMDLYLEALDSVSPQ